MGLSGGALGRRGAAALLRSRRGASFPVAGVALSDIHLRFTWQAWQLWDWSGGTLGRRGVAALLCGRRGTWRHLPSSHVAGGVYLATSTVVSTWQAWHLATSTFVSRGANGAGLGLVARLGAVALGKIYWAGSGGALIGEAPL